jgi:type II secretory pathway component GspD/PulD (secretin)
VTTGFSLSLLPRIDVGGDGLLMQFGINTSDLNGATNGFDVYTTPDGKNSVQLPNINSRNFVQQAYIPNGSTLVLAGYEQQQNSGTKSGVGDANFMGLGGQQIGKKERDIIVILLTPIVLPAGDPLISTE